MWLNLFCSEESTGPEDSLHFVTQVSEHHHEFPKHEQHLGAAKIPPPLSSIYLQQGHVQPRQEWNE